MNAGVQHLLQTNPIVPYAVNGFQRDRWFNYNTTLNGETVKKFIINVFANTNHEALFYANQLKAYIDSHPIASPLGGNFDMSTGLQQPRGYGLAYQATIILDIGVNLRAPAVGLGQVAGAGNAGASGGSSTAGMKGNGGLNDCFDCGFMTRIDKTSDVFKDAYKFEFSRAFSIAYRNRTRATKVDLVCNKG